MKGDFHIVCGVKGWRRGEGGVLKVVFWLTKILVIFLPVVISVSFSILNDELSRKE